MNVQDIRDYFRSELEQQRFTIDKTGAKTIEIIGASFKADANSIFGTPSPSYIAKEMLWYDSGSTNINDISDNSPPPAAWMYAADAHGNINSNYGHLIFSEKYGNQFERAVDELISNKDSRRATMVYTRPSIWVEYNEGGKSDFICTNAVNYYIRDGKLHSVVQMRSNDAVFGYKNDYAWQLEVMNRIIQYYNEIQYIDDVPSAAITLGDINWQVANLHVYERHFDLIAKL
tara:strand:- start:20514 stop:21206 length:693 start_codon:yes stop_codon:yes gene_type:complete